MGPVQNLGPLRLIFVGKILFCFVKSGIKNSGSKSGDFYVLGEVGLGPHESLPPPPWKNPSYAPDFEGSHNSYLGVIHCLMGSYNKIKIVCILHDPCRFCHVRKINVTVL